MSMQHRVLGKCAHFGTVQDDNCIWEVSGMNSWEWVAANRQITQSFCFDHNMKQDEVSRMRICSLVKNSVARLDEHLMCSERLAASCILLYKRDQIQINGPKISIAQDQLGDIWDDNSI